MEKPSIGQQIRMAMNDKSETIRSVAASTALNVATIHRIIHDEKCDSASLQKIANHLAVQIIIYPQ